MRTKSIAILLALIMVLGVFAGCQSSELRAYSDDAEETPTSQTTETKDYTPVFESFAPDTVMMTINDIDVTWQELFYWYHYDVTAQESSGNPITDWEADNFYDSTKTNKEFVMNDALETLKSFYGLKSKAQELGVELSDEDKTKLDEIWQSNVDNYGKGEEDAFIEYLSKAFLSKELFYHINEINALYPRMLEETYGKQGEKLDEAEILAEAEELGYMRAKHILFTSADDAGAALSDEALAEKRASAEAVLAELKTITDPTALETRFEELIAEHNEDPGAKYYTDGYTFTSGEMLKEFEAAVSALEPHGLSEIVETSAGYHIILRLPLSTSAVLQYTSETETTSLEQAMAQKIFNDTTATWAEEAKIEFSKEYEKMDIAELFSKVKIVAPETE